MSEMAIYRQLSAVRRTATAASCSLFALPHSFRTAAVTDEQLVYGRSALLTRVFAPAASRRFLDVFTAWRTCFLVVSHGFWELECNDSITMSVFLRRFIRELTFELGQQDLIDRVELESERHEDHHSISFPAHLNCALSHLPGYCRHSSRFLALGLCGAHEFPGVR
jgi:hypothetical protein